MIAAELSRQMLALLLVMCVVIPLLALAVTCFAWNEAARSREAVEGVAKVMMVRLTPPPVSRCRLDDLPNMLGVDERRDLLREARKRPPAGENTADVWPGTVKGMMMHGLGGAADNPGLDAAAFRRSLAEEKRLHDDPPAFKRGGTVDVPPKRSQS